MYAGRDALCTIDQHLGVDAIGHSLCQLAHLCLHRLAQGYSVRAGLLIDGDDGGGLVAKLRRRAIGLVAQLHTRHIAQSHLLALFGGAEQYVGELLGRGYLPRHRHRVGELRSVGCRLGSKFASWVDTRLGSYGRENLVYRYVVVGEQIGTQPHTHSVFASTHNVDLAYSVYLEQLVLEIDVGVVREETLVVATVAVEGVDQEKTRLCLACNHALLGHRRW